MTSDLRLLNGFACGVSLSLHVRVTCLHSGSWLLSGFLGIRFLGFGGFRDKGFPKSGVRYGVSIAVPLFCETTI